MISYNDPCWPDAKPSQILTTLNKEMFAEVICEKVPGDVVWCNYELARDLGFSVPRENYLDKTLKKELLSTCSVRVSSAPKDNNRKQIKLYADRYGGFGMGHNLGSARGAFLPFGNLFIKGLGRTPLYHDLPGKLINTHGNLHMWHGLYVAALAEVCLDLFETEPARILCVIDQGGETVFQDGRRHERAVAVRAGHHFRPAHVALTKRRNDCPQATNFILIADKTGQLVFQSKRDNFGNPIPDLNKTMVKVVSSQAKAAALHARWRLVHGSLCAANTLIDGGALDIAQARTNPRCVPLAPEYDLGRYTIPRGDYGDRVNGLEETYHAIRRSLDKKQRNLLKATPLEIREVFDQEYLRYLEVELGVSTGLKRDLINILIHHGCSELHNFAKTIIELTTLMNPESFGKVFTYNHSAAVVDIFSMLKTLPKVFFEKQHSETLSFLREKLRPHFLGDEKRIILLKRQFSELTIDLLVSYSALMSKAKSYIDVFWSTETEFMNSVVSRAEFENTQIDEFFFDNRFETFQQAATDFRISKNQQQMQNIVQRTIVNSCRNIDAILWSGGQKHLKNSGMIIQIRRSERITYGLCVFPQKTHSAIIRIELCLEKTDMSKYKCHYKLKGIDDGTAIRGIRLPNSKIRFEIDIPVKHPYGAINGYIMVENRPNQWIKTAKEIHYVYAVPDDKEFQDLKRQVID